MISFLMRKVFYKKLTSILTEIHISKEGFSINEPFDAKSKLFYWNVIDTIQFSENKKEIIIKKKNKKIRLKNTYTGWYEFIQKVPEIFSDFDFKYASDLIDSLKPCGVCGIVSVKENKCIVCETIVWNDKMIETEIDYLKSQQLNLYSELIKEGKEIKKTAEPEHGFKANKNWKLYL